MRTSATQFETLISYMEEHGDLNKPSKTARGRIQTIENWDRLTSLLNADPVGQSKSTDRWKKVWSDLKNNTKKKAARLRRAASGTGGGPALQSNLSAFEERVLNIIGTQAATGLTDVVEAGVVQELPDSNRTLTIPEIAIEEESPSIFQNFHVNIEYDNMTTQNETVIPIHTSPSSLPQPISPHAEPASPPQLQRRTPTLVPATSPPTPNQPAQRGHTPQRRRRGVTARRTVLSPRPRSHIEQSTQHFLNADAEWRKFVAKYQQDQVELHREKLKQGAKQQEIELKWQEIASHALVAFNKIIDYYVKQSSSATDKSN